MIGSSIGELTSIYLGLDSDTITSPCILKAVTDKLLLTLSYKGLFMTFPITGIGSRLRILRLAKCMIGQQVASELSEKTGRFYHQYMISRFETGKTKHIEQDEVKAFAEIFNVDEQALADPSKPLLLVI